MKYTHLFSLQPFMAISHLKIVNIFWVHVLTPNVFYNPFNFKPQNKPKQNTSSTCTEWYGYGCKVLWLISDHSQSVSYSASYSDITQ